VFDRLEVADDGNVLEVGCGIGELWRENADRVPRGWRLTLVDRSPGMIAAAIGAARSADLIVADVQALPLSDASFDVAIANHMLYHVGDRARALAELARVLRPGGRLVAATVGRGHLEEIRQLLARVSDGAWPGSAERFGLETGPPQLEELFEDVQVERYPSTLVVTEAEPLVAYCLSMREASGLDEDRTRRLRRADRGDARARRAHRDRCRNWARQRPPQTLTQL
jgi:ubiquinone/menaquinone biosynthesis C-methylase UbiE